MAFLFYYSVIIIKTQLNRRFFHQKSMIVQKIKLGQNISSSKMLQAAYYGTFQQAFHSHFYYFSLILKIYYLLLILYESQLIIILKRFMFAGLVPSNNGQNGGEQGAGFLNMNLVSKAVDKILKYNTEKEAFNTTYPKTDHLQRVFNEKALTHYTELITNKYNQNKKPLAIVDLCCGYGMPTFALRERLLNNGVQIEKIIGYDISDDMIKSAQNKNEHFPQLQFHRKNIDTQFDDVDQYDVAICLFSLQWLNELEHVIAAVHKSLRADGIFLTLTPIEIKDLFDFRTKFINTSRWSSAFEEEAKTLHPFSFTKDYYLDIFGKYFTTIREEQKQTKFNYNLLEFVTFLQSWLQEVRHLTNDVHHELKKDAVARGYIAEFIDSIERNLNGNVIIHNDGSIIYTQHTFDFDGQKK